MRRITRYTFKNPANEPKIKNIIKPKGFVPRYLSTKIPITVPTMIAATISTPIRKPKGPDWQMNAQKTFIFDVAPLWWRQRAASSSGFSGPFVWGMIQRGYRHNKTQ